MANGGVGAVDGELESEERERERERERESSGRERGRKSGRFYRALGERRGRAGERNGRPSTPSMAATINGAIRERTCGMGRENGRSFLAWGGGQARADIRTEARAVRGRGAGGRAHDMQRDAGACAERRRGKGEERGRRERGRGGAHL
jgi:hypothetical protein